ncbi:hypothetical protein SLE2022_184650 [Rubroshorea leprosula]
MGRSRQCVLNGLNKGAWTSNEDKILTDYVRVHGEGKWTNVAKKTDLKRCGKSCRLRWKNYLKPDIKRGNISHDEEELIIRLHKLLGNRWSLIAGRLPGRTDNEIKNYWNTTLARRAEDFEMKVFAPIRKVDEVAQTMCKATYQAVLVDTAAQSDQNQYLTPVSIGPSAENYMSRKMGCEFKDESPRKIQPSLENHLSRKMEYEFEDESTSSLPKLKDRDNGTDFLMDFNLDDISKFLDTDIVQMNDDKVCLNGGGGEDGGDGDLSFLMKLAVADKESSLDFQSLASSFLESAEKWPPISLNNISIQLGEMNSVSLVRV